MVSYKNFGANLKITDHRELFRELIIKLRFNLLDHIAPNLSWITIKSKMDAKKFEGLTSVDPLSLKVL